MTIRAYDPKIDGWRVTFVAPISGATVNLIAREHDDEIWLEGRGPDNSLCRWTFSEMTDRRVRWQGFASADEGSHLGQRRGDTASPTGVSPSPGPQVKGRG